MINKLNLFKVPIQMYYKNSTMYSHWSGLIATLVFTVFLVCALVFFGMDFYLRENPSINIFKVDVEDYEGVLNKVDHDPKVVVGIPTLVAHRVLFVFFDFSDNTEFIRPECTPADLEGRVNDQMDSYKYFCFDLKTLPIDFSVRNMIMIVDCKTPNMSHLSGYEDLDLSQCNEPDELEKIYLFHALVPIYYPQANLNMNNYDNPISYSYRAFTGALQEKTLVNTVLQTQFLDVNDDKGWIFKDESSNYGLTSTLFLESSSPTGSLYDYRINLSFFNTVETHKRIYTKIQNLAAEVGGFMKLMLLIIKIPIDFLAHHSMKSSFLKNLMTNDNVIRLREAVDGQSMKQNFLADSINCSGQKNKQLKRVKALAEIKKKSVTAKLIYFKLCPWAKRLRLEDRTILKASSLAEQILSVETVFKSFFEQDILKRMLLSEEDRKVLKLARRPDIYEPEHPISSRHFREDSSTKTDFSNRDKETTLRNVSENFRKVIKDYL